MEIWERSFVDFMNGCTTPTFTSRMPEYPSYRIIDLPMRGQKRLVDEYHHIWVCPPPRGKGVVLLQGQSEQDQIVVGEYLPSWIVISKRWRQRGLSKHLIREAAESNDGRAFPGTNFNVAALRAHQNVYMIAVGDALNEGRNVPDKAIESFKEIAQMFSNMK